MTYDPRKPYGLGNGVTCRANRPHAMLTTREIAELGIGRVVCRDNPRAVCPCSCDTLMRECPSCKALADMYDIRSQHDDAHLDHDGENQERRREVARMKAETKEKGGCGV